MPENEKDQEIERLRGINRSLQDALNHWRKAFDGAGLSTAAQCAQLAASLSDSYDQLSGHAIGAMSAACAIRRHFGLAECLPLGEPLRYDAFASVTDAVANHYLDTCEASGLKVIQADKRGDAWYALKAVIAQAFAKEAAHA